MHCRSCQALLEPGATTCFRCGSTLTTTTDTYDEAVPYIEQVPYMEPTAPPARVVDAAVVPQTPPLPVQEQAFPIIPAERGNAVPGWMITLLALFSLLLIIGGSGFLLYATAFRPGAFHAQATAVAQNFLTAQVQSTIRAHTAATATANAMTPAQIYKQATSGKAIIDDPLRDDSGKVWFSYGSNCKFSGGAYHVIISNQEAGLCVGAGTYFEDLAFQAQLMIIISMLPTM